jgi:hypothetical protein
MTPSATELGDRVLATLEEAHIDNVFAILNTVIDPHGGIDEVEAFVIATRNLFDRGLIEMGYRHVMPHWREEVFAADRTAQLIAELQAWFAFDRGTGYWTTSRGEIRNTSIPFILLTSAGLTESGRLLDERGYEWWRPRR